MLAAQPWPGNLRELADALAEAAAAAGTGPIKRDHLPRELRVRAGLEETCDATGAALLVTSHNMTDVERICERVVFLSHGLVVADGPPADVARQFGRSNLEEVFLHLASEEPI